MKQSIQDLDKLIIGGCFRSGTTIMARMLNMHSELFVTGELCSFIYPDPFVSNVFKKIKEEYPHKGSCVFGETMNKEKYDSFIKKLAPKDNRWKILQDILDLSGKKVKFYGDKLPEYIFHLKTLTEKLKSANKKLIICIRDPRDIINSQLSAYKMLLDKYNKQIPPLVIRNWWWAKPNALDCIYTPPNQRNWLQFMNAWECFKDSSLCTIDYIEVNYDNMMFNSAVEAKKIADFLDINQDETISIFTKTLKPINNKMWKKNIPTLNNFLPSLWKEKMEKYNFSL